MPARRSAFAAALLATLVAGCGHDGPEVAAVEGTVRLDGQPLEGAKVVFTPVASGRPSSGRTDASGRYELVYTADRGGALVGDHSVSVTTFRGGDPDSGVTGSPEILPVKYNAQTELKGTVTAGENEIDFALDTRGKVVQPRE